MCAKKLTQRFQNQTEKSRQDGSLGEEQQEEKCLCSISKTNRIPFYERLDSFVHLYKTQYEIPAAFKLFKFFFNAEESPEKNDLSINKISKEGIVMTEESVDLLLKNHKYLFSEDNKNYLENFCVLFDSQETRQNIADMFIKVLDYTENKQKLLDFLAKYSKNPNVWSFLTSILEWNIGTRSLRYKIKELNKNYDQSKSSFLFHGTGFSYPTESDFIQTWLEKRI
jgi:hypothetical protein